MAELELYTFACGLDVFRYTDALLPVTYLENLYAARPIKRGAIEQSADVEKSSLTITVPLDLPLLDLFRPAAPLRKVLVNVQRTTRGAGTARTVFSGTLANVNGWQHTAELTVQNRYAAQANVGLRRKWQKACPYVLYGAQCGVSRSAYRTDGTVSAASGRTVSAATFAGHPDGWFTGGYVTWTLNGNVDYAFVTAHAGDTLTLLTSPPLSAGMAVSAYPGCDHTTGDNGCNRFSNVARYGGQPYIPTKNPFGQNKIF